MLDDAAAMLDSIYDEPTAICSQATSPHFAEMALEGLNDGPGIPLQVRIITRLHVQFRKYISA